jgi:predicted metal-dependent hydrolase
MKKVLCKIDFKDDKFIALINNEPICNGTREECLAACKVAGIKSASIRYTDNARVKTSLVRFKRMVARKAAGKSLNKYDEQFIVKYSKVFSLTDDR